MRIYTKEQLQKIEDTGVICPECGLKNLDQSYHGIRRDFCFSCNFWTDRLESLDREDEMLRLVIDKHFYSTPKDAEQRKGNKYSGFGGRKFLIKINKTQEIFETCNLWHQGEIPMHFLDRLPDNATFLNEAYWIKVGDTWCMNTSNKETK